MSCLFHRLTLAEGLDPRDGGLSPSCISPTDQILFFRGRAGTSNDPGIQARNTNLPAAPRLCREIRKDATPW